MDVSQDQLKHYIDKIFDKYDTDRNNTLDQNELYLFFKDLFASMGNTQEISIQDAKHSFKQIDINGDGRVTKTELLVALRQILSTDNAQGRPNINTPRPIKNMDVQKPQQLVTNNQYSIPTPYTPEYYENYKKKNSQKETAKQTNRQIYNYPSQKQIHVAQTHKTHPTMQNPSGDFLDIGRRLAGGMDNFQSPMGINMTSPAFMGSFGNMGMGMGMNMGMGMGMNMGLVGSGFFPQFGAIAPMGGFGFW